MRMLLFCSRLAAFASNFAILASFSRARISRASFSLRRSSLSVMRVRYSSSSSKTIITALYPFSSNCVNSYTMFYSTSLPPPFTALDGDSCQDFRMCFMLFESQTIQQPLQLSARYRHCRLRTGLLWPTELAAIQAPVVEPEAVVVPVEDLELVAPPCYRRRRGCW